MWPKDDYQEHMLDYLDGVRIEIEQSCFQSDELNEFYIDLDISFGCLWELIGASDVDWEGYRYPLETSCDELLRALHQPDSSMSVWLQTVSSLELLEVIPVRGEPEMISG